MTVTRNYRAPAHPMIYVQDTVLERGREYLVYGEWLGATRAISGELLPGTGYLKGAVPDVVNPTASLAKEEAAEEVAFLEQALQSPSGATVFGTLLFGDPRINENRVRLPGIRLRAFDDDNRLIGEVETGEGGRFMVSNVPAGLTWIEARLPEHMWTSRKRVDVVEAGCSRVYLMAVPNGRVRGRVLRDARGPIRVDLMPVDDATAASPSERRTVESKEDGQFEFVGIPPGRYRLGVNLARPPGELMYSPTFYPGTVDSSAAKEIVVGDGTLHDRLDFALDAPLRRGSIDVRLPFDGGRKATICLWDSALTLAKPGGATGTPPDFRASFGVVEGRRYYVAARVEGTSGDAESEIIEVVATAGRQVVTLSANRHAPALSDYACHEFHSRTLKSR